MAVGGAIGTAARYGVNRPFPVGVGELPVATFGENVLGAALLGLLLAVLASRRQQSRRLRLLLATGTLGAFTTFSTFATELALLLRDSRGGWPSPTPSPPLGPAWLPAPPACAWAAGLSARLQGPSGAGHEPVAREAPNR